jgi:predicted AAA+ superfamily ATPase
MKLTQEELFSTLSRFNPWWQKEDIPDLPTWHRAVFHEFLFWILTPPSHRAIMLSGTRQVGKTTLILQAIHALLKKGVSASNILYVTFDHPLIKNAGIEAIIEAWRQREKKVSGPEYLFLDEIQFIPNASTWIKHQVDFAKQRNIIFTGSALSLLSKDVESAVGRIHTINMTTLSFYEYLQIRQTNLPKPPKLASLRTLFEWTHNQFSHASDMFKEYVVHFHEYLLRGGFPHIAQIESITRCQQLMREDLIEKVLKRDLTSLFGVRRVTELENTFLYLCMHDGGLLDMKDLCQNLEVTRPTAQNFIHVLEASHLIYRLPPYGYGKEIFRARYKIYLSDPAIASAITLKGKSLLEDPTPLGVATETAVFTHLFTRYYTQNIRFHYWRSSQDKEVDLIATIGNEIIPFEVKYRSKQADARDLKGLIELCMRKNLDRGYIISKNIHDFGPISSHPHLMRIPAPLFCYWMGDIEHTN